MWNWKNGVTKAHGIPYSRYIASYRKEAEKLGTKLYRDTFEEWLLSIGVNEDEASDIVEMATNGKLELETSARIFIQKKRIQETES